MHNPGNHFLLLLPTEGKVMFSEASVSHSSSQSGLMVTLCHCSSLLQRGRVRILLECFIVMNDTNDFF